MRFARALVARTAIGCIFAVPTAATVSAASGHAGVRVLVHAPAASVVQSRKRRATLSAALSWGYQLRIHELAPLVAATSDLLVIDHGYSARPIGKALFTPAEIAALKTRPDGRRRIVLSYLSIGEAEQYRFYWQASWCNRATAPAWMGAVNPNWPGNYPVRFWDVGWQKLILDPIDGYLAKIQAQGFDGVYLDRADVYSEWTAEHPHARADMVAFLAAIAQAARAQNPQFLIVMQNAEELLEQAAVRRTLDGVAKEDLLYGETFTEQANAPAEVAFSVAELKHARADKLPVFAVEYLTDPAKMAAARRRLLGFGFIPTFAPRLLDLPPRGWLEPPTAAVDAATLPRPVPPIAAAAAPGPAWGEGGPTCLTD